MKRFLLSYLLITSFLACKTYSQDDFYKIRLFGVSSTIPLKGYYVERVINAQDEDTIIGFVQTGMFNKKRLASFNTSIEDEISKYLKIVLPPDGESQPLIVRINKLNIFEVTTSATENAFAELNLSFIRRDGSKYYHLFDAGTCIRKGGIDVTHTHAENIVEAMVVCFDDLSKAILAHRVDNVEVSEKELSFNPLKDPGAYAIFHVDKVPKGIFRTFYDFRDCKPDTSIPFEVQLKAKKDSAKSKVTISYPDSYGPDTFWGLSDGNSVYIRIANHYYKLYRDQHAFISLVAKNDLTKDGAPGYAVVGILGGLVGTLIFAAVVSATNNGLSNPSKDGNFRVDFCHGALTPASHPELNELYSKTIFAVAGTIDPSKPICLFVNNKLNAVLKGGSYYKLNLPPMLKNALIELKFDSTHCTQTIPLDPWDDRLYYVYTSKKSNIHMQFKMGEIETSLLQGMTEWNTIHPDGKESEKCNN